ncbi:MAG: molecular chaperone HtpG [Xanthomonadales bacterium]|nr:Chaperone protein HtpG [Xanthomonadales bacterium]MCC6594801.1 molecular chaperone HtpG [Xanthomonadales bacterium]MCE7929976.1 molecular chaperone HtpG [Xanthomonadales bacterium PRO6]
MSTETRAFQAEVQQVLNLVIHSLYSNKEIFLRELVSNASDALDKLRFEAIRAPELMAGDAELRIELEYDEQARTLTIRDNGIGMTLEEVVENIGTIARSGTRRFLESLSGDARKDAQLIGQFGVGFYSAFIVADRVELRTRRAGAEAADGVLWTSDGKGEYSVETIERTARGSEIVLYLKEGEGEFAASWRLRSLVHKYSEHIAFPIRMRAEAEEGSEPKWETVNQAAALWTRPKTELKDEDYQGFFKHLAHSDGEALAWSHNKVEGGQSYTSLLYIPAKAPFDLFGGQRDERQGLKLYVKRVFIMDAAEHLLPAYLRFVRGVVDSDDLPLNVSRELLQDNKLTQQIRSAVVKRTLDLLDKLAAEQPEKFADFWREFGQVLKEGLTEDYGNRERIARLLRFASTASEGAAQTVSLQDYLGRLRPNQTAIYYITAETHLGARHSPHLEAFRGKGVEVILAADRIDEWALSYLREFEGKPFVSVAKGDVDLSSIPDAEGVAPPPTAELPEGLAERVKAVLGDKVKAVRGSARLRDSAAVLVVDQHELSLHTQRLLKQAGQAVAGGAPTLELNPAHPVVMRLAAEGDEARFAEWAQLVHEQAVLSEGGQLEDPSGFVRRLNGLLFAS